MLLNIDFANLKTEGYTALILSVIFTIIALASVLYYARHRDVNKTLAILFTLVLPAVSVFCWIYLLTTILSMTLVQILCISFACAIAYVLIAVGISYLIERAATTEKEKSTEEVTHKIVIETKVEQNAEDETEDEDAAPVLVMDNKSNDKK